MHGLALAGIERRVRRLERQNRFLIVQLCSTLAVGSIAVSHAQPTILSALEVRAQRFTLTDPDGGVADNWYIEPSNANAPHTSRRLLSGYSSWAYYAP
jgi:hypothetical protein